MKHRVPLAKQIQANYPRGFLWKSASFVLKNSSLAAVTFLLFFVFAYRLPTYAQTAYNFIPVMPCRIADTRNAQGPFGGPAIAAQSTRSFAIPSSACNIPATAAAYALNVTVVPQAALGYLTVWPTGQPRPIASTLNSLDGRIKANAAIIPGGSAGAISIFATNTTDVALDISGYFVPNTNTSALYFFPIPPCRIADTRNPTGSLGGPSMMAGIARSFPVQSSGCGISGVARAYSLNFTVVPKSSLGYLTIWPSDGVQPDVSTLNAPTGAVTANAAIVPAAANGSISAYATNDSDLIIDINGYFGPASSGNNPLSLFTIAPCRVLDTRTTAILNGTLNVNVAGTSCGIPSAASAHVMNATVVPSNSLSFLTLWPYGTNRPLVSTLNAIDGFVTSNMAIVPDSNGWIDAYSTDQTHLILDITGYFADISTLQLLTSTLPNGTQNTFYTATLSAQGGLTPYSWTVASGTLPPGLTLNIAGVLSGTPTSSGTSSFTVKVTDGEAPAVSVTKQLMLTIAPGSQTATISPRDLNWLKIFSLDNSANTPFPGQTEVAIGEAYYGSIAGCSNIGAYASLARFDLSQFQGKTIDSVTLSMTAVSIPPGQYPVAFQIGAVATNWSPSTVTWNSSANFRYYSNAWPNSPNSTDFPTFPYPTYVGELYNIDATYVAKQWQSGNFSNNGVLFQSTSYFGGCTTIVEADVYSIVPQLTVIYH